MKRHTTALLLLIPLANCQQYVTQTVTQTVTKPHNGGGIVLASQSIALPDDMAMLPASAQIVATNCTACHSPELILTQPRLKPETWQAEIAKMRTAYKAGIEEKDDPQLVAALMTLQSRK